MDSLEETEREEVLAGPTKLAVVVKGILRGRGKVTEQEQEVLLRCRLPEPA